MTQDAPPPPAPGRGRRGRARAPDDAVPRPPVLRLPHGHRGRVRGGVRDLRPRGRGVEGALRLPERRPHRRRQPALAGRLRAGQGAAVGQGPCPQGPEVRVPAPRHLRAGEDRRPAGASLSRPRPRPSGRPRGRAGAPRRRALPRRARPRTPRRASTRCGPWGPSGTRPRCPRCWSWRATRTPACARAPLHALGAFASDDARQALAVGLEDAVEDVRWNAALALARQKDARAATVLGPDARPRAPRGGRRACGPTRPRKPCSRPSPAPRASRTPRCAPPSRSSATATPTSRSAKRRGSPSKRPRLRSSRGLAQNLTRVVMPNVRGWLVR